MKRYSDEELEKYYSTHIISVGEIIIIELLQRLLEKQEGVKK
jgi:hypothetical protein